MTIILSLTLRCGFTALKTYSGGKSNAITDVSKC